MLSFIGALPGAVSQGLIWGIMAVGVYITYKILDIADLTVDGSFCTGGAVFVVLFGSGANLWLAMLAALAAGLLAGLVTGLLHTACGIPAILAGILTQLALWSVNLAIMGMKANVAINVTDPANLDRLLVSLRFVQDVAKGTRPFYRHPILVVGVFSLAIISVLYWFFGTELGASLRATGANPNMARAQGINTDTGKVLGLMLSNGLVALSGALLSQYQSFADSSMGKGAIVIGLAAVIIGQVVFGRIFRNFALKMLAVSLGAVIYYAVIQAVVSLSNINTNYLKLISAVIVAVFLSIPYWKGKYFHAKVKTGGASHA
ncbi:ABC transporter permease [uncultured Oscillibacter sp.]|jgi:putative ABC transport system permease protein|uniref:ABC transporter permease n=1 Tax=uncultured Oscillibacter sp. TaxID=876091 RepID=UPI002171B43A|nr:ABC transporter permease [uncultured Oscillibacter sp.]MCI9554895.1 ABC transporter permease [Oscillibacter sp.]